MGFSMGCMDICPTPALTTACRGIFAPVFGAPPAPPAALALMFTLRLFTAQPHAAAAGWIRLELAGSGWNRLGLAGAALGSGSATRCCGQLDPAGTGCVRLGLPRPPLTEPLQPLLLSP